MDPCDPSRLRLLAEDRLPPAEMAQARASTGRAVPACRETLDRSRRRRPLAWGRSAATSRPTRSTRYELRDSGGRGDRSTSSRRPTGPTRSGRLGTYEVKGVLGRGGMGVVFKAFDPALNRNVAIKVLAAALASCGAARRRFLREARAAAAVVHEHVVAVFAVVESAGLPFLVMEYVPGRSLQDRLDQAQGRWRCRRSCGSACRRRPGWRPPTPRGWSTATSSRRTSCWRTASSGCG